MNIFPVYRLIEEMYGMFRRKISEFLHWMGTYASTNFLYSYKFFSFPNTLVSQW